MIQENFIKIYEKSFKKNWELPALTDYSKGTTFSFADVAKEIARIHILFEECQIRRGDKIALIGKDRCPLVYCLYGRCDLRSDYSTYLAGLQSERCASYYQFTPSHGFPFCQ